MKIAHSEWKRKEDDRNDVRWKSFAIPPSMEGSLNKPPLCLALFLLIHTIIAENIALTSFCSCQNPLRVAFFFSEIWPLASGQLRAHSEHTQRPSRYVARREHPESIQRALRTHSARIHFISRAHPRP